MSTSRKTNSKTKIDGVPDSNSKSIITGKPKVTVKSKIRAPAKTGF